jgi:hypothetical protein
MNYLVCLAYGLGACALAWVLGRLFMCDWEDDDGDYDDY